MMPEGETLEARPALPKLLAIDLDGTLVDSAPDIAHCLGTALETLGFARPGEAHTRAWIGDGLENLIARALAHATGEASLLGSPSRTDGRQAAALDAFLRCYRDNLFVRSRLYPEATATLDALREAGVRLCCITNKRVGFSEQLLTEAGIRDRFELLLGGDSLAEKKPSPLPLRVAAQSLRVEPAAAVLLGDSHQDLHAARSAGFRFVLAGYGYGASKIDAAELGDTAQIARLGELPGALGVE
jgi:phosphoglycolate phosphatase